jgi:hypothetical protein
MKAELAEGDLLAIALKTLAEDLTPRLKGEERYLALLIGNALGIVGRELAEGGKSAGIAAKALGSAYGDDRGQGLTELAADIRAGRLDGNADVGRHLLDLARARAELSNPKAAASY